MFENPRRGREAKNFTTNVPKILDLKSSSEQKSSDIWRRVSPWNMERSDRYLFKKYEKVHRYSVCWLEYRFSLILTFHRVFKHASRSVDVILWRIRLLVFITLVTWPKLVVSVFFTVATTIEVKFSRYMFVCKYGLLLFWHSDFCAVTSY